jgi:hypothetical protein
MCQRVCKELSSCDSAGPYQDCLSGFHCAEQTQTSNWQCYYDCTTAHPTCDTAFQQCYDKCVFPCAPSCDKCGPGEVCFGGLIPNTTIVSFAATCRKSCSTDDECAASEKCIQDPSVYGRVGRVCLPPNLERCNQEIIGSCVAPSVCNDESTLQRVYFDNHSECGLEFVHCPNGCEGPSADGGIPDGGSTASCR